jgi:selenoprotein W-related protein
METLAMTTAKPIITITYCTLCHWLLRSAWSAQELLSTFGEELGGVTLVPARGGIFTVHYNDEMIWDRLRDGGFPDAKEIKKRVRDRLDPDRDLGHIDRDHRKTPE